MGKAEFLYYGRVWSKGWTVEVDFDRINIALIRLILGGFVKLKTNHVEHP